MHMPHLLWDLPMCFWSWESGLVLGRVSGLKMLRLLVVVGRWWSCSRSCLCWMVWRWKGLRLVVIFLFVTFALWTFFFASRYQTIFHYLFPRSPHLQPTFHTTSPPTLPLPPVQPTLQSVIDLPSLLKTQQTSTSRNQHASPSSSLLIRLLLRLWLLNLVWEMNGLVLWWAKVIPIIISTTTTITQHPNPRRHQRSSQTRMAFASKWIQAERLLTCNRLDKWRMQNGLPMQLEHSSFVSGI